MSVVRIGFAADRCVQDDCCLDDRWWRVVCPVVVDSGLLDRRVDRNPMLSAVVAVSWYIYSRHDRSVLPSSGVSIVDYGVPRSLDRPGYRLVGVFFGGRVGFLELFELGFGAAAVGVGLLGQRAVGASNLVL